MTRVNVRNQAGFTMIELATVVVIIAIVTTVVVSRWAGSDNEMISQIEIIKAHLRYAQSKAMSTSSNWYVHFETSPSPGQYTLFNVDHAQQYFPGEANFAIALKPGISLGAEIYILFDRLGRPYPNNTAAAGTQLTVVQTIVTSPVGNVEVKPETGFVP